MADLYEGTQPNNPDALENPPQYERDEPPPEKPRFGEPLEGRGPLLDEKDEVKVAKLALKLFFSQKQYIREKIVQGRANALRRKGVPNVSIKRDDDNLGWSLDIPVTATPDALPAINKAAALVRRLTSVLLADPPAADVVPSTGEDEDTEASEFAGRVLEDIDSESGINHLAAWRAAIDRAHSWGSAFTHYYMDPRAGGYHPIEVMAGSEAQTIEDAEGPVLQDPVTDPATGQPVLDPATGQPMMRPQIDPATGEPKRGQWGEYVLRMVTPDGKLTDDPAEAASRWLPGLRRETLDVTNVRAIPHDASDIWECAGFQIGWFKSWGWLKSVYPQLERFDAPEMKIEREKFFSYKPETELDLLRPNDRRRRVPVDKENVDERLVFGVTTYYVAGPEYPEGCICVTLADRAVAFRDNWISVAEDGRRERMDIPVSQMAELSEGEEDFFRTGMMQIVGPGNEVALAIWSAMLEHLEAFGRRKIFAPLQSNLKDSDMRGGTGRIIRIVPGGQPFFEQLPEFPAFFNDLWGKVGPEMNDAAGLPDALRGLSDPSVQSGRHEYMLIGQALAGLSELRQNVERYVIRGWRICLQLVRAYYDLPRKLRWEGADGDFKQMSWTGADLSSTVDVKVKAGTLTMLSPVQKQAVAERYQQMGLFADVQDFRDVISSSMGGMIGLQDDPARLHIKRQLARWTDGPPEGWVPAPPPQPQAQIDPQTGQQSIVVPPPTLTPAEAAIWQPTPSDTLPSIAAVRLREIARFMQSKKYLSKAPEWRMALDAEFARMQAAASPPPQIVPPAQPTAGPQPGPMALGSPSPMAGAA